MRTKEAGEPREEETESMGWGHKAEAAGGGGGGGPVQTGSW